MGTITFDIEVAGKKPKPGAKGPLGNIAEGAKRFAVGKVGLVRCAADEGIQPVRLVVEAFFELFEERHVFVQTLRNRPPHIAVGEFLLGVLRLAAPHGIQHARRREHPPRRVDECPLQV